MLKLLKDGLLLKIKNLDIHLLHSLKELNWILSYSLVITYRQSSKIIFYRLVIKDFW